MTKNIIEKYDLEKYIGSLEQKDVLPADQREELFSRALGIEKMALAQTFYQSVDPSFLRMKGETAFNDLTHENYYTHGWATRKFSTTLPLFATYDTLQPDLCIKVRYSCLGGSLGKSISAQLKAISIIGKPGIAPCFAYKI